MPLFGSLTGKRQYFPGGRRRTSERVAFAAMDVMGPVYPFTTPTLPAAYYNSPAAQKRASAAEAAVGSRANELDPGGHLNPLGVFLPPSRNLIHIRAFLPSCTPWLSGPLEPSAFPPLGPSALRGALDPRFNQPLRSCARRFRYTMIYTTSIVFISVMRY